MIARESGLREMSRARIRFSRQFAESSVKGKFMKWVTKPMIKEAEQFFEGKPLPFATENACCLDHEGWYVFTTHGHRTPIADGDFIVREPNGNGYYPCKPDIWLAGHELV